MNEFDPEDRDDWEDHLVDQSLNEVLGDESPPDLSERILAAAAAEPVKSTPAAVAAEQPSWREMAIAASVLVAVLGGIAGYLVRAGSSGEQQLAILVDRSDSGTQNEQRGESDQEKYKRLVAAAQAENQKVLNEAQGIQGESVTKSYPVADLVLPKPYLRRPIVDRGIVDSDGQEAGGDSSMSTADRTLPSLDYSIDDVPFNRAIEYPSAEEWEALTVRRKQYSAIDSRFAELSKTTKTNHQATSDVLRLQQRRKQLEKQLAAAERVLAANDLFSQATSSGDGGGLLGDFIAEAGDGIDQVQQRKKVITAAVVSRRIANFEMAFRLMASDPEKAEENLRREVESAQTGKELDPADRDQLRTQLRIAMLQALNHNHVDIPPPVGGVISIVKKHKDDIFVEVTIGSDDGLRKGHRIQAFRNNNLLGDIEIVRTTPDRAVGKIVPEGQIGEIKERDRVQAGNALPLAVFPELPEASADRYVRIVDNPFYQPLDSPLSTFSIDVDTASYTNVRKFLLQQHRLPPPDAVRIEELINYFDYAYQQPKDDVPFAAHLEVAACPWQPKHRLARIALKGAEVDTKDRPRRNLVFLLDVSGSMNSAEKLPLVVEGMKLLVDQLRGDDHVAIVVYAGAEGLVLNSTPASERGIILQALENLRAGGSTNGGAGIQLAYQIAADHVVAGGINRVILCTDGDFNVGVTADGELERLVVKKAKSGTYLTVLGFGSGNLNDAMMENISNKGNGNYAYIDSLAEAQRVLVQQATGTLLTIAKDVKLQVEFNPAEVASYRLIGYGNRLMDAQDFNDDTKDAGDIGAGHTVTAFYEIVPTHDVPPKKEAQHDQASAVDPLKYQRPRGLTPAADSGELFALRIRYKRPDENKSQLLTYSAQDNGTAFNQASADFQFAAAVASFGMVLRGSQYAGDATYETVLQVAQQSLERQESEHRNELVDMVHAAIQAAGSK